MGVYHITLLALFLATCNALVVKTTPCGDESICEVSEVRIEPCNNAKKCVLTKGKDATISFDFTPKFDASKLVTKVFWDNGIKDIPFEGMGSDVGCEYTSCPITSGNTQTLVYTLQLAKTLPKGSYPIKWKLWNEDDETKVCCFKTNIQLKNKKS